MELLSSVSLVLSPFLIKWITSLVKRFVPVDFHPLKTVILRFVVALMSFGSVLFTGYLNGSEIDPMSIETFANAIITFVGATGFYFWSNHRKANS